MTEASIINERKPHFFIEGPDGQTRHAQGRDDARELLAQLQREHPDDEFAVRCEWPVHHGEGAL